MLYFVKDHDGINATLRSCTYIVAYYNSTFNCYFKMDNDWATIRGVLVSGNSELLCMLVLQGYATAVDYALLSATMKREVLGLWKNLL